MPVSTSPLSLQHHYATELPELVQPWQAEPAPSPQLVVLNESLAAELGLDADWLRTDDGLRFLVGTSVPEGATPVAQAYAGHQFGGYSPRLGDGRALLLGELDTPQGCRDLHLKGSGRTPYARGGDGLAALGPMLREYVVSEAMHALGIATTRALAVVATGRGVQREGAVLPGAVLARVASSHLRVGTFQYARTLDDPALLQRLADHAIRRHHPEATDYLAFFEAVRDAQAGLVARWMGVGFVHGVMNTDNVTISGETIDYGPCAFLDAADPATVFSSIDHHGRYAFGNQPAVTGWNLARFAEALLPLLHDDEPTGVEIATASLQGFGATYAAAWTGVVRRKLGLGDTAQGGPPDDVVAPLGEELVSLLQATPADHTGFWRDLSAAARGDAARARDRLLDLAGFDAWVERWRALGPDAELMDRTNPVHVPRNHLVEEALDAATAGDFTPVRGLLEATTQPFQVGDVEERYRQPAPDSFGSYTTFCGT